MTPESISFNGGPKTDATSNILADTDYIWTARRSADELEIWIGGVSNGALGSLSGGVSSTTICEIGAMNAATGDQLWDGDVAEVFFCNAALSLADMNNAGEYLSTKWTPSWTTIS